MMNHYRLLDIPAQAREVQEHRLTNFALSTLLSADEHTAVAVWHQAAPEESCSESFPGLHGLHSQVGAHRLWYRVKVLTRLQALFRQRLDLRAPE